MLQTFFTFKLQTSIPMQPKPITATVKPERQALSLEILAKDLSGYVTKLKGALDNVKREERNYQYALANRDKKLENWQTIYTCVASISSALFQLGGRKDLADRVRPTTRKQNGTTEVPAIETNQDVSQKEPQVV